MTERWRPFSTAETDAIPPGPLTDPSARVCPVCDQCCIRFYYHELERMAPLGPVGFTYFWCGNCHRYAHSRGEPKSPTLDFDDPLATLTNDEYAAAESRNWYERLDTMWTEGTLPQRFETR